MQPRRFFAELKRRRVYSIATGYVLTAWLLIQIATQVFPFFSIPAWAIRLVVLVLILGLPIVLTSVWALGMAPEGVTHVAEANPARVTIRRVGRGLTALVIILATLATALTLFRLVRSHRTANQVTPARSEEQSIAVLPFANLSDDKENAYFVSGMRDEILTSLAQLQKLTVRSRVSADKYNSGDLAALGRELDVRNILEGSVQKAGDDVLITVQLIETRSGTHLWGQSYRRRLQNVFDVQGEIAQQVANALAIELAPAEQQRLHVPATTNVRAHELFLRAHALGAHADERSLEGKIALLQRAVAEDPHYAMAWGDLAGAYLTIADAYRPPREVLGRMRQAAMMAVQTDEGSGVGHIWLGAVSMLYDRNFPLAKRELQRAVTLNPNSADAHRWLGWYLARVERDFDGGRAELQKARSLDPLYTWPLMFESLIQLARGDFQSAMRLAEQVLELDPHFFYDVDPIANVYCGEGRWLEAARRYESLPRETMTKPNFQLALCYAHLGENDKARRILADLEILSQRRYIDQVHLAAIYAALGERDQAFAALDRACDDRSARVSTPRFYGWLSPLFDDPRFAVLEHNVAHSAILMASQPTP